METEGDSDKYYGEMKHYFEESGQSDIFEEFAIFSPKIVQDTFEEFCFVPLKSKKKDLWVNQHLGFDRNIA